MPSEMKGVFTDAKALKPKAAWAEYVYKLFNGSKSLYDLFNSRYNKISLIHN